MGELIAELSGGFISSELGRLGNYSPTCKPKTMIGMAVEEDTALILQANRLRVTGKKLAHIFLQSADP
jgi:hypothetical protein